MTEPLPRLFEDDGAIHRIGEGLLASDLSRADWTHEAHLAACCWMIRERPDINPEADMRDIISAYNISCGTVNDDTQGYHETITQVYIAAVRAHLRAQLGSVALFQTVNALLLSPLGRRDLPLKHYTRERMFSAEARCAFIPPDIVPLNDLNNMAKGLFGKTD